MLVPKPKNAFQSPGAQMAGFVLFITFSFNHPNVSVVAVRLTERRREFGRV